MGDGLRPEHWLEAGWPAAASRQAALSFAVRQPASVAAAVEPQNSPSSLLRLAAEAALAKALQMPPALRQLQQLLRRRWCPQLLHLVWELRHCCRLRRLLQHRKRRCPGAAGG